jgi:hypothetical protein
MRVKGNIKNVSHNNIHCRIFFRARMNTSIIVIRNMIYTFIKFNINFIIICLATLTQFLDTVHVLARVQ